MLKSILFLTRAQPSMHVASSLGSCPQREKGEYPVSSFSLNTVIRQITADDSRDIRTFI